MGAKKGGTGASARGEKRIDVTRSRVKNDSGKEIHLYSRAYCAAHPKKRGKEGNHEGEDSFDKRCASNQGARVRVWLNPEGPKYAAYKSKGAP